MIHFMSTLIARYQKMIEDDRIVSYIIKQIKISLKIPILEVLLLKVADDGTIFFEE